MTKMITYNLYATEGVKIDEGNRDRQFQLGASIPFQSHPTDIAMVIKFGNPPQNYMYRRIEYFKTYAYVDLPSIYGGTVARLRFGSCSTQWPLNEVTWDRAVGVGQFSNQSNTEVIKNAAYYGVYWSAYEPTIRSLLDYGLVVGGYYTIDNCVIHSPFGENKPYLEFSLYDDNVGLDLSNLSPTGGYVSKHSSAIFSWNAKASSPSIAEVVQSSAIFRWRAGANGTIHTVSAGPSSSITIPAGTFTADEIQWSVQVTANSGITTTSDWYTLTTAEEKSTAKAIAPNGQIIDARRETKFQWEHVISTGTEQTGFDLQTSNDGIAWTQLVSRKTSEQTYISAADTFTAGSLYWRVRTYNTDSVAGEWSNVLSVIVIGFPPTPSVVVESNKPRWIIRWNQTGQEGYEVEFDGDVIATAFGRASRYQYTDWATPGPHNVRVRIQNQYGLWSEWGAAAITIVNVPGAAVTLTAVPAPDVPTAQLSWTGEYDRYVVYRDGVVIGHTFAQTFTDKFGCGPCVYQVRGISEPTDYYTMSNSVTVDIRPKGMMLYDITHQMWIDLALSEMQSRSVSETSNYAASYLHFAGTRKPSVEFGEETDRNIAFDCAFRIGDARRIQFEEAMGGIVCLKNLDGTTITGALVSYSCKHNDFYCAYQSSVVETDFDEVESNG